MTKFLRFFFLSKLDEKVNCTLNVLNEAVKKETKDFQQAASSCLTNKNNFFVEIVALIKRKV